MTVPLALLLAACSGSPDAGTSSTATTATTATTALPPTTAPALSKHVSYGGISVRVPATFRVRSYNGCPIAPDDTASVGAYVTRSKSCPATPLLEPPGTGMALSSTALVAAYVSGWQTRTTVNGITVDETVISKAGHAACARAPCPALTDLAVSFPSYEAGALFVAEGSDPTTSLALARSIVGTVAVDTGF